MTLPSSYLPSINYLNSAFINLSSCLLSQIFIRPNEEIHISDKTSSHLFCCALNIHAITHDKLTCDVKSVIGFSLKTFIQLLKNLPIHLWSSVTSLQYLYQLLLAVLCFIFSFRSLILLGHSPKWCHLYPSYTSVQRFSIGKFSRLKKQQHLFEMDIFCNIVNVILINIC